MGMEPSTGFSVAESVPLAKCRVDAIRDRPRKTGLRERLRDRGGRLIPRLPCPTPKGQPERDQGPYPEEKLLRSGQLVKVGQEIAETRVREKWQVLPGRVDPDSQAQGPAEEGNPTGIKCIMKSLNISQQGVRLPLVEASENLDKAIKKELAFLKLAP